MAEDFETQLREALIEQTREELCKYYKENSELIRNTATPLAEKMLDVISTFVPFEEEELKEYKKQALVQLVEQYQNPALIREMAEKQAREQLMNYEELLAMTRLPDDVREEIGEEAVENYEREVEKLKRVYYEGKKEFFDRLTEIARKEGIEKAVTKETRNRVLREMFPNPDDYRVESETNRQLLFEILNGISDVFMSDGELGKGMGTMTKSITNALQELSQKLGQAYLEKEIEEIYGEQ